MLERHDRAIEFCTYCPKLCRFACPVAHAEARETVTPQAKQALADHVRKGHVELTADVADVWYRCTGCGLHSTACDLGVQVAPVMFEARAEAVRAGAGHPALEGLVAELDAEDEGLRAAAVACADDVPLASTGTLWFAGCEALRESPDLARDGFHAARKVVGDKKLAPADAPGCCGYPLLAAGHPEALRRRAEAMMDALHKAELVITGDPICAHTMRVTYAEVGIPLRVEVRHLAEVAAERLPAADLELATADTRRAYHDPCYLGRHLGVREQPRSVIEALTGKPPLELPWSARGGYCSGGGGLLPRTTPSTADAIARDLAAQATEIAADEIITACPRCHRRLSEQAGEGFKVTDLSQLLAR